MAPDNYVEYSVKAPTTAASVFSLALRGLNTLGKLKNDWQV